MKTNLSNDIDVMKSICLSRIDTTETIYNEITTIEERMEAFRACVPFIGEFSVGKSSLLNHWLGENLLPEGQRPTTALATELRHGVEQAMYIVESKGETKKLDSLPKDEDEANAPSASQGLYAFCVSPSLRLKDVAPLIPVDMPGVNSSLERHTKALYRYANQGVAFFLVFSPDQGTMNDALAAFLVELELDGRPVWIVLHKCDTATDEKIEEVSAELTLRCRTLGIEPKGILYTSRLYENTPAELSEALSGLDAEELRDRSHIPAVRNLIFRLRNQLCTLRDACDLDLADFDKRIQACRRAREDLDLAVRQREDSLHARLAMLPENVANDIYKGLIAQRDALVYALETSKESFTSHISGIINRILTNSLQKHIEYDFREFAEDLAAHIQESEVFKVSTEKLELALRKVNEAFKSFNETAKASEAGKLYKLITTCLAVTTSVLTPIIELVIIFLPDLISLFCNPEEIKRRKIEEQLSSKIFPDIRGRVNRLVQDMLPELERDMRDALHGEWSAQIADVEKALIQAQEEKKQALSEADNQREQLDGDIHTLERMHHKLALVIKDL